MKLISLFISILLCSILHGQELYTSDTIAMETDKASTLAVKGRDGAYLLVKTKHLLHIYDCNKAYRLSLPRNKNLDDLPNSNQLCGAEAIGGILTVILTDAKTRHFTVVQYDRHSGAFLPPYHFDMEDILYVSHFVHDDHLAVLGIKKNSSLLSVFSFDTAGHGRSMKFDLSTEKFDGKPLDLQYFIDDGGHVLHKYLPDVYYTELETRCLSKLYVHANELFIVMNKSLETTELVRLDLRMGGYDHYSVPIALQNTKHYTISDVATFMLGHRLYTAALYNRQLEVSVYDHDSRSFIRRWGPAQASIDSLASSPYLYENFKKATTDTLTAKKFFSKLSLLSIAANLNAKGDVDLIIGMPVESSGGPFGDMLLPGVKPSDYGMGLAPAIGMPPEGVMNDGPEMASAAGGFPVGIPTMPMMMPQTMWFFPMMNGSEPTVNKHCYFYTTLDTTTYQRAAPSQQLIAYTKMRSKYFAVHEAAQNISVLNCGTYFVLGDYYPDQLRYCFRLYK
jgi:hypothetical protein